MRSNPRDLDLRLSLYNKRLEAGVHGPVRPVLPLVEEPICLRSVDFRYPWERERILSRENLNEVHRYMVLLVGHAEAFSAWNHYNVSPTPEVAVSAGVANRARRRVEILFNEAKQDDKRIERETEKAARHEAAERAAGLERERTRRLRAEVHRRAFELKQREFEAIGVSFADYMFSLRMPPCPGDPSEVERFKARLAMVKRERDERIKKDPDLYLRCHASVEERRPRGRGVVTERTDATFRHTDRVSVSDFEPEPHARVVDGYVVLHEGLRPETYPAPLEPEEPEIEWEKCGGGWRRLPWQTRDEDREIFRL